ncbi:MAG: hypothetical protein IIA77_00425 [Proteobacteria bacterium]|nr:hypothetical protein [Pseudomonadota bacterium]
MRDNINVKVDTSDTNQIKLLIDTQQVNHYVKSMKGLLGKMDSIDKQHFEDATEIVNLVGKMNIPIGWQTSSAPVSWFYCSCGESISENPGLNNNDLAVYMEERNTGSIKHYFYWLLGIIITGISLSFGAPFWFDALMKLVNLRRAGKKPIVAKL